MNDTTAFTDHLLLWFNENMRSNTKEQRFNPNSQIGLSCLCRLAQSEGRPLADLITSSAGLAPNVFRTNQKHYLGSNRSFPPPRRPSEKSHERKMCFDLWTQQLRFRFVCDGTPAMIHSYEVPLVGKEGTKATDGNTISLRYIDLLASSSEGLPIVIEAKHSTDTKDSNEPTCNTAVSQLFAQFIQGLCYTVTLRYTWSQSPSFREAWSKLPAPNNLHNEVPDTLEEVPIILAADPGYWGKSYLWGDEQKHWKDLCTLVKVAQNAGCPIYVGVIREPVSPDTQWQFQVVAWDSLPTPTTNGPIQFPTEPTS